MTTNIVKWGNSQGIRLPRLLLESVDLKDNDTVEVTTQDNRIIIKKFDSPRPHKTIQERFQDFDGRYEPTEIDWGQPVGKELW